MAGKLIIVESPAKAKTIKKILKNRYKVEASMGHVRDLPKSRLGVDLDNNFEPKYITIRGKGDIIKTLKQAAKKADEILLATDPDREGEAISWHLANILDIDEDSTCRIEFNEITETAIKNAVKNPRPINKDLVDAQQARRILDRVVGYKISPLLWKKVKKGLSAGRVQSVATRIICDREKEINAFIPKEYWTLKSLFDYKDEKGKKQKFEALYYGKGEKKQELNDKESVDKIISDVKGKEFVVVNVKKGTRKRNAPPPFTTSTLQQEASRKLGFSTRKTMMIAQQLYEGLDIKGAGTVGLLTYIRTDSTRVSNDAQNEARTYISDKFGGDFVPKTPNVFKGKKSAQDAHEAIRPTYLRYAPGEIKDSLDKDQLKLYTLVYNRFVASQMTPAVYETMTVNIRSGEHTFRATGSRKIFNGYTAVYVEGNDEGKEDGDKTLPALEKGQVLNLKELVPEQHFTTPPPRYTEASLIKTLEEMGIGRPSTYSPTISTIMTRGYVARDGKALYPTELGLIVNDLMMEYFPDIMDYKFTAAMEEKLDEVEEGKQDWQQIIKDFYEPFERLLNHADKELEKIKIEDEKSDVLCEKCGANMVIKMGRFGKFLACPNFPECRNTKPIVEELGIKCPKCNEGNVVIRKTKRRKKFYGCDRYPECDFVSWDLPSEKPCPKCNGLMVEKNSKRGKALVCADKECGHKEEVV